VRLCVAAAGLETFGNNTQAFVEHWSNNNGQLGSKLETLVNPMFGSSGIANYDFTSSSNTILQSNQSYWLLAYGTANGSRFDWKASSPVQTPTGVATHFGALFDNNGPPPTSNSGILNSYSLSASAVPEPTSIAMFGIAMLGLARRRR
jgi:hypothetical protein